MLEPVYSRMLPNELEVTFLIGHVIRCLLHLVQLASGRDGVVNAAVLRKIALER